MRNVTKAVAILSLFGTMAAPAAIAAQPNPSASSAPAAVPAAGGAYPAPFHGPAYYGPAPYYGPWYGPGYSGWGRGGGSGRMRVSFDFDGLLDGWLPWRGWWW